MENKKTTLTDANRNKTTPISDLNGSSESKGTESQEEKQANEKKSSIQGLENYTDEEIDEMEREDFAKSHGFGSFAEYEEYERARNEAFAQEALTPEEEQDIQEQTYNEYYERESEARNEGGDAVLPGEQSFVGETADSGTARSEGETRNAGSLSGGVSQAQGAGEGEVTPFSRQGAAASGMTRAIGRARMRVENALKELGIVKGKVRVVTDIRELPASESEAFEAIKDGDMVEGWYNVRTGDVYLFAPNIRSGKRAKEVVLHELVAHKGLRGVLGKDGFDELCDDVWNALDEKARRKWMAYVLNVPESELSDERLEAESKNERRTRAAADEYMANVAEHGVEPSLWEKVKKAVLDALRRMGVSMDMTDADIRSLLNDSYQAARTNERGEVMTPENTSLDESLRFARVNHNSPYLLKKADGSFIDPETGERLGFDHRFMGTGEGNQVHGWGSYFSVNDIRAYGQSGSGNEVVYNGKAYDFTGSTEETDLLDYIGNSYINPNTHLKGKKDILDFLDSEMERAEKGNWNKSAIERIERMKSTAEKIGDNVEVTPKSRHHYDVEIPDNDGTNYIEEGRTLQKSGRRKIANVVRGLDDSELQRGQHGPNWLPNGLDTLANVIENGQLDAREIRERLVDAFGSEEKASRIMHDAGFVGIHYDGRRDGECYVIFDENDAKIVDHVRFSRGEGKEKHSTFAHDKNTFNERQKRAANENGIVLRGLNESSVDIVKNEPLPFDTNVDSATEWAEKNLVTTHEDAKNGNLPTMADGTPYEISKKAVGKYLSESAFEKSTKQGLPAEIHYAVLPKLKDIIATSIDAEIHPSYKKGADGKRSVDNGYDDSELVHRMYGAFEYDGEIYPIKTTMIEYRGKNNSRPHSYEVTKIELPNSDDATNQSTGLKVLNTSSESNSIPTANLLKGIEKSYDKGKKLLDESENTLPDGTRFSRAQRKTLMGVHNISEDKLRKALKMGGLANPSLAVIDTDNGIHSDFGDISLIPASDMIDAESGGNAGTYSGDAWTPTYPTVHTQLTKQGGVFTKFYTDGRGKTEDTFLTRRSK